MLTPKRKSQVIDGEVTEPIKIAGRETRVAALGDRKHFRMTLLLRKCEESVPADAPKGSSAKGKKERPDRHEETKGGRRILVRSGFGSTEGFKRSYNRGYVNLCIPAMYSFHERCSI